MADKFKKKFDDTFTKEEIENMKKCLEQYKNAPSGEFTLKPYYYMTIIRKIIALSSH